jgi:hypothetical protein
MALCPLCESENPEEATECASCGRVLLVLIEDAHPDIETVPGLEQTLFDPLESGANLVETLPELQPTMVARRELQVDVEPVEGVEPTQLVADPSATSLWGGGVPLDLGREPDDGQRTPLPAETGLCPWCRVPSTAAVCDSCGRRRSRYSAPPAQARAQTSSDTMLCPACFARVELGPRCVECGVPFPPQDIL